jgi:hypothetical protein
MNKSTGLGGSHFLRRWLIAWAQLLEGVVAVVTLGQVWPSWHLKTAAWYAKHRDREIRGR